MDRLRRAEVAGAGARPHREVPRHGGVLAGDGAVLHAVKEHGPDKATEALQEAIAAQPDAPEPPRATIPGTAKPSKAKPVARPKAESKGALEIKTVLKAVKALLAGVTAEELASEDEFVGVDRVKLAALAALVR